MTKTRNAVRKQLRGRAGEIARNLKEFAESEAVFSAGSPRLVDRYENSWVGVYQGRVAASGKTLGSLKRSLKAKGIPLPQTMIRRIDREERTLIL
jgi:hypothetical protein